MEILKSFTLDGTNVNVHWDDDKPYFRASEIGTILGMANINKTIGPFNETERIIIKTHTRRGIQPVSFLTMAGLPHMVAASRKPNALELARVLGIDVISCKISTFEGTSLRQIMVAFCGEDMVSQYRVGNYFIDLYFPKFKLALECDEGQHDIAKHNDADNKRQHHIQSQLGCKFVRYKPHIEGFCIFKVINDIYMHIQNGTTKTPPDPRNFHCI